MEVDFRIYTPNWYKKWFLKKFSRLNKPVIQGFKIPFTKADLYIDFNWLHLFGLKFNRYEFCISVLTLTLVIVRDYAFSIKKEKNHVGAS